MTGAICDSSQALASTTTPTSSPARAAPIPSTFLFQRRRLPVDRRKGLVQPARYLAGQARFSSAVGADTYMYVPLCFFYGYGGGFTFNVTAPSGQVIVRAQDIFSPYEVRYSCDGMTAALPEFGKEI
ncbi:hypothetical protein V8C44DRAFT_317082 [Trichoderma aethiopicum]